MTKNNVFLITHSSTCISLFLHSKFYNNKYFSTKSLKVFTHKSLYKSNFLKNNNLNEICFLNQKYKPKFIFSKSYSNSMFGASISEIEKSKLVGKNFKTPTLFINYLVTKSLPKNLRSAGVLTKRDRVLDRVLETTKSSFNSESVVARASVSKNNSLLKEPFNLLNFKNFRKNGNLNEIKFSKSSIKLDSTEYNLETYHRSNQDTCLVHKPSVFEGQWVQSGDLLADCSASLGGELALGQNILIAYMPWEGYNFEDAILISERLVYDDLYTSIHIERYDIEINETKLGVEQITREIPDINPSLIKNLDEFGIIKLGSWVEEGDILVGKVTPIPKQNQSPYQKLLYTILEKQFLPIKDSSLRAPKGIKAKVIGIQKFKSQSKLITKLNSQNKKSQKSNKTKQHDENPINNSISSISKKVKESFSKNLSGQTATLLTKETSGLVENNKTRQHYSKSINPITSSKTLRKQAVQVLSVINTDILVKKLTNIKNKVFLINNLNKIIKNHNMKNKPIKMLNKNNLLNILNADAFITAQAIKNKKINLTKSLVATTNVSNNKMLFKKSPLLKNKMEIGETEKKIKAISSIHIYLAEKRKIQVGDKMAGRHGNKGIISQILPREDMPFLPDGTPLDMVLNPLGVPSRMNVGQIYECLLGLAGKHLGESFKVFPFDEIYGAEASRTFVYSKLFEARQKTGMKWLYNNSFPGKVRLYDGRTGDCFDQPITVGYAYMLRLVHMVDDKIHARSTGPYSLVTQQPLRGRSKQGGQRLGEMEVWAIEGYGAAFTLLEMLTIKSDDMTGRMTLWSNLILNKEINVGTPESFKVLISELQALCLDIGLFRVNQKINQKTALYEIDSLMNLP
uniref:RNA polymerase beta subunit II n=1 Tax=Chlamydomonas chlamydogama TaxID=225041 RepID=UPI00226D22BE|nr:RNA polymerase beta subunit II [Chlamydomonas chlamydogama]UZA61964.1 RNA polymerase beta subunit II [Chlamydomonas chlamydogama]